MGGSFAKRSEENKENAPLLTSQSLMIYKIIWSESKEEKLPIKKEKNF